MKTALICGISGQDGAYLTQLLLGQGYRVVGASRNVELANMARLDRLGLRSKVELHSASLTDFRSIVRLLSAVEPDEIYNLSGQSSVGLSFEQPLETIESLTVATINLLEAIRFMGNRTRFYNAGSSECFGNTNRQAADENTAFQPCSPYGVGKSAAHWIVSNYREAYGIFACNGILFNHESPLRPAHFVTQKIVQGAVAIKQGRLDRLALGNLSVHRDWGWAPEYVDAMHRMLQVDEAGDFVIATGQTYSLQDFVARAFAALDLDWREHVDTDPEQARPLDIAYNRGDAAKAARVLDWQASKAMPQVVDAMVADALG